MEIDRSLTKEDFNYGAQKYCKKHFCNQEKANNCFFNGLTVTIRESLVNVL